MLSKLSFNHLLSAKDVQKQDILLLLDAAASFHEGMASDVCQFCDLAKGKILASLFFEASTRTRFSFESAMCRLGGAVLTLENGASSSVKKGETLSDMGRIVSGYADIIVMRHPASNSVKEFSEYSQVPVINAGDGPMEHPSQSLVDLYSISYFQKKLDGLSIGFVGDLKFGRTVNSLVQLLAFFPHQQFYFISHPSLKIHPDKVKLLRDLGHRVVELSEFGDVVPELDVLYMTRVQAERFESKALFDQVKDHFVLTEKSLLGCKPTLSIFHPLPRINEISIEVDQHPAARYFDQAKFGVYVRMAVLWHMLGRAI